MHEGAGYRMKLELGVMLPAILSALAVMAYLGFPVIVWMAGAFWRQDREP